MKKNEFENLNSLRARAFDWIIDRDILLGEERGAFLVGGFSMSPGELSSRPSWDGNDQSEDEKNSHDNKGKDPLEGDNLMGELRNTKRGREHTEGEANGVIFVNKDEKESVDENGPNKDVAKDAGYQVIRVWDHESTIPVDCDKSPCQRTGSYRSVDEARIRVVAEVERREIEEVENENNLGPVEMRSDKEHDKGEVKQIVCDEVASHAGGGMDNVGVAREEVTGIASLKDK